MKHHGKHHSKHHKGHRENPRHHYGSEPTDHAIHEAPGHHSPSHYTKDHHSVHNPSEHRPGGHSHEEFRAPHHSPGGGVANNDGFTGKTEKHFTGKARGRDGEGGKLAGHHKQPHGKKGKEMVGFAETRHHEGTHDTFHGEIEEHWGHEAKHGGGVSRGTGENHPHGNAPVVGYVRHHNADHDHGHSRLVGVGGAGHKKQPHKGDDTDAGRNAVAEHHVGHVMKHEHDSHESVTHEPMTAHVFKNPMGGEAHGYGHESYQRHGFLRHSGHKGAHRIGRK